MELHITNSDAARLASELAQATGHSVEEEVLTALRERAQRVEPQRKIDLSYTQQDKEKAFQALMEIIERCSKLPVIDSRTPEEILYDENGLPK